MKKTSKNILVIAAHPDDEILGCGGTMALHAKSGDKVKVVIMAEGLTSRAESRNKDKLKKEFAQLYSSAKKANATLGVKDVTILDFPDNRMDSLDLIDVIKKIEKIIDTFNPEIIYTHHFCDLNVDHQIINKAVMTATRPIPGQSVKRVQFFEVASSTDWGFTGVASGNYFNPNIFINIDSTLKLKLKALSFYHQEMRDFPHARSIEGLEALAKWRGAFSGFPAAEAFVLGRELTTF